jgi:Rrf2 family protein
MHLSKKAEYALRALVAIARQPRAWQVQELSRAEKIPDKFLEQILLILRRGGLLTSKRGLGGGYTLHKPASEITLGEVIAIMDGPLAPVPCAAENPSEKCTCPDPQSCPIRKVMIDFRQEMEATLNRQTIEDLVRLSPSPDALAFEI